MFLKEILDKLIIITYLHIHAYKHAFIHIYMLAYVIVYINVYMVVCNPLEQKKL